MKKIAQLSRNSSGCNRDDSERLADLGVRDLCDGQQPCFLEPVVNAIDARFDVELVLTAKAVVVGQSELAIIATRIVSSAALSG